LANARSDTRSRVYCSCSDMVSVPSVWITLKTIIRIFFQGIKPLILNITKG
jgi:hypothetical protein